ncbi:hypothetical protein [Aquibacillus salsiterrae]|uniref:Uncharacterized protein n=1 Tax=Aquibacillus salsiterrae TaxID=2950439 RepID=A0A9X4AFV0_9BACI|nr:hypothetical protein [Aquibacillus salsiterrae]MDC3418402.1 hypothetical protein [Aquibacillus salsiterrae]
MSSWADKALKVFIGALSFGYEDEKCTHAVTGRYPRLDLFMLSYLSKANPQAK